MESNPAHVVAVLGKYTPSLASLAERTRQLGHRTIRAEALTQAIELSETKNLRFSAALLNPEIAATGLSRVLNDFRRRTDSAGLVYIAAGLRPDSLACTQLRQAGVELALWNPVSDQNLRFQLNRATSGWTHDQLRGEFRVPTNWATRIVSSGREKTARIYSLSGSGAFLATQRPSMRGADVSFKLPLPSGAVHLAARVVYTNVPGNRRRDRLPDGMAVQFEGTPPEVEKAIRDSVDAMASDLAL